MVSMTCEHCGAGLQAEARFCRSCGQPASATEGRSVTEATTQIFDTPARAAQTPDAFGYAPEAAPLAAVPYGSTPVQRAPTTQQLDASRQRHSRRNLWLVLAGSSVVVLLLLALLAVGLLLGTRRVRPPSVVVTTPPVTTLPAPPPPSAPVIVPVPEGASVLAASGLMYPGAKIEQTIMASGEGQVVRLHSNDAFDKVVRWYETKFKPTEKVVVPGAHAVLEIESTAVIITADGKGTSILLTQDSN